MRFWRKQMWYRSRWSREGEGAWEWLGHAERRDESETIRAVAEMKMEGKRPRGRPKLEIHCQKGPETVALVNRQTETAAEIRQKYVRNTSKTHIRRKIVIQTPLYESETYISIEICMERKQYFHSNCGHVGYVCISQLYSMCDKF